MRGDVRALSRLESQDARADISARLLKRKLDRKARNKRAALRVVQGRPARICPLAFSASTNIIAHMSTKESRKKLLECRDSKGSRIFYIAELLSGIENVSALIVAPRTAEATPERIGREIAKGGSAWQSSFRVALIHTESPIRVGGFEERLLLLTKIRLQDGQTLFYVFPSPESTLVSPPRLLGLDAETHGQIVRKVARMLGVDLRREVD